MERIQGLKEYVQTEHYLEGIGIGKEEQKEIQITYQPLAQGEYNINYWFVHPLTGKKLVLRVVDGSKKELPYGVMVMEFLEGSALDYRKNLMEAAECLADIHSVPVKETDGLISPSNPLQAILDECNQMVQTYYEADLGEEKKKVQVIAAKIDTSRYEKLKDRRQSEYEKAAKKAQELFIEEFASRTARYSQNREVI